MSKVTQFFGEVKSELSKVVWPTRSQVIKYTVAVMIFSLVVSLVLGATDYGLTKALEKIINR